MRTILKSFTASILIAACFAACKKSSSGGTTPPAPVYYDQADQVGRPAINTVFISASGKDSFNTTPPSQMSATFGAEMKANLLALTNPAGVYLTGLDSLNLLGLSATSFIGVLSKDVLNVSTTGKTTFYDGVNVLTGRALSDDVIHVELILLFGGHSGSLNPTLSDDHVSANDATFLVAFPYLATPH
ncbi:MAG TPA: DUF4331 family protein [Puia sp.]